MLELLIQGRQRSFYVGDYRWPAGDDGSFGHCPTVGSPFNANWSASSYPWGRAEGLPLDCTIVSPSSYSLHKDACASGVLHGCLCELSGLARDSEYASRISSLEARAEAWERAQTTPLLIIAGVLALLPCVVGALMW